MLENGQQPRRDDRRLRAGALHRALMNARFGAQPKGVAAMPFEFVAGIVVLMDERDHEREPAKANRLNASPLDHQSAAGQFGRGDAVQNDRAPRGVDARFDSGCGLKPSCQPT